MGINSLKLAFQNVYDDALDSIFLTAQEKRLRERDERLAALFERGGATSAEIYAADFGTAHPNGLDVPEYPAEPSRFVRMTDDEDFKALSPADQKEMLAHTGGCAGRDERIFINPMYYEDASDRNSILRAKRRERANTIVHEHTHRRQGIERDGGWESTFTDFRMRPVMEAVPGNSLWQRTKRLYQKFNQCAIDHKAYWTTHHKISDYFSREVEMQARLHEIMAIGYTQWQSMPATRAELWAALHNLGVRTPGKIMKELKGGEEGKAALKKFRCNIRLQTDVMSQVNDLNRVDEFAVLDERKNAIWERVYPYLYGNMVEQYGDGPGRARLGLGSNPQGAKTALRTLRASKQPLTDGEIGALAAAVPADRANELINALVRNFPEDSEKLDGALRLTDALLARGDVRKALQEKSEWDFMEGIYGQPVLRTSVAMGHKPVIARLMKAGLDPQQPYTTVDMLGNRMPLGSVVSFLGYAESAREMGLFDENPVFNGKSFKDEAEFQEAVATARRMRDGMRAMAENYPDIDTQIDEKGTTPRAILRDAGIETTPAGPGVDTATVPAAAPS